MDSGPTISRPYTRHKWVGRMICSHAIESARAQDLLRLPESMTIIKNRTDNLRFSFPLLRADLVYESYVPAREFREKRSLVRHRISLVRNRTMLENKVHTRRSYPVLRILFGKATSFTY